MSVYDRRRASYESERAREILDTLGALLAIPKFANGIRVPVANIHARLGSKVRVMRDERTNDLILYLEGH